MDRNVFSNINFSVIFLIHDDDFSSVVLDIVFLFDFSIILRAIDVSVCAVRMSFQLSTYIVRIL